MGYRKLDQLNNSLSHGNRRQIIFWIIVIFFLALYLVQVCSNHYFLRTYAFDYALYNNAVWDYSHFRINANPVFNPPLKNFFQDHISFTLILIQPIFWIINPIFGTYSLLIIEVLFMILGGIGCYKFVSLITKNSLVSLLALLHYFMLHGHFAALAHDYHDVVIGASMITWFIYFFAREKFFFATLVFLFVILSKENMPLWLVFILFVLIIYKRKNRRSVIIGSTLFLVSISYFVLCFAVLIPYFEDSTRPHWAFYYNAFGSTPTEVFKYFITHPFSTFLKLFYNHTADKWGDWVKMEYYFYFLLFGGWLLFKRPLLLLLIFPVLAQKMLMDSSWRWSLSGYSSIEITSILTVAVFYVIAKMKNEKTKQLIAICTTSVCIIATIHAFGNRHSQWHDSTKENILSKRMFSSNLDLKTIYNGLELIPPEVAITVSNRLASHLAYRSGIYVFPEIRDAEYMVLLDDGGPYPISLEMFYEFRDFYSNNDDWEIIYNESEIMILKSKIYND